MVRLTATVNVSVSSSTSDEKDLGNLFNTLVSDAYGEGGTRKVTIAAGSTDLEVDLCNISVAGFLFLKVEPVGANDPGEEITVKFDATGGEPRVIAPPTGKRVGFLLLTTDSISSLFVTHAGTNDVELTIVAAGD